MAHNDPWDCWTSRIRRERCNALSDKKILTEGLSHLMLPVKISQLGATHKPGGKWGIIQESLLKSSARTKTSIWLKVVSCRHCQTRQCWACLLAQNCWNGPRVEGKRKSKRDRRILSPYTTAQSTACHSDHQQ